MRKSMLLLVLPLVAAAGCYRATIETGLTPSGQTVRQDWATSFVGGLVPPAVVETASRCPTGVAKVQTQLSFLNMVVSSLTMGIYTPMSIEVQCAAARGDADAAGDFIVPAGAAGDVATQIFNEAASRAAEQRTPVTVQFE